MSEPISTITLATHGVLALFWAIVHALDSHRKGNSKTLVDFIILVIMSSFAGVMFTIIWLHLFPASTYLIYAMSGTWWYIGIEWMSVLVKYLKSKI